MKIAADTRRDCTNKREYSTGIYLLNEGPTLTFIWNGAGISLFGTHKTRYELRERCRNPEIWYWRMR